MLFTYISRDNKICDLNLIIFNHIGNYLIIFLITDAVIGNTLNAVIDRKLIIFNVINYIKERQLVFLLYE